jgi:hypothetical protein
MELNYPFFILYSIANKRLVIITAAFSFQIHIIQNKKR